MGRYSENNSGVGKLGDIECRGTFSSSEMLSQQLEGQRLLEGYFNLEEMLTGLIQKGNVIIVMHKR